MKTILKTILLASILTSCSTLIPIKLQKYQGEKIIAHGQRIKKPHSGYYFVIPTKDTIEVSYREYNKYIKTE